MSPRSFQPDAMGNEDDRELMLQTRSGSRQAFTALVARYESRLVTYFFRQCHDRELAEDCAQEVFVRLYKARERYGPQARFSTFLYTIARNYWIDVTRARRVRPKETSLSQSRDDDSESWGDAVPASEQSPLEQTATGEDVGRLRLALEQLPRGQREAVLLGVIEGMPYADVSQILGVPVGTVKSRVHAAVATLRQLLVESAPGNSSRGVREG